MSTTYTTNYHLGKQTDTSDTFDMSVITDNMDIIDTQMKSNKNNILSIQSNVESIENDYSKLIDSYSGYVDASGIIHEDLRGRHYTNLIPVVSGTLITYRAETNHQNISALTVYNGKNEIIDKEINIGSLDTDHTYTVPNGAYFVRFSLAQGQEGKFLFSKSPVPESICRIAEITADNTEKIDEISVTETNLNASLTGGKYIEGVNLNVGDDWTTKLTNNANSKYLVAAIDVSEYRGLKIEIVVSSHSSSSTRALGFCNENNIVSTKYTEGFIPYKTVDGRQVAILDIVDDYFYFSFSNVNIYGIYVYDDKFERRVCEIAFSKAQTLELINGAIYVDGMNGNDSNDGTSAHPLKTIQAAIDKKVKNIIVSPGEYSEAITISNTKGINISPKGYGTYSPSVPDTPKIKLVGNATLSNGIRITNSYDISITGVWCDNYAQYGCYINECTNITMTDCVASNCQSGGIVMYSVSGTFKDCLAYNIGGGGVHADGFNIHGYGDTQFINCVAHDCGDDGISHHDGCTGLIMGGEYYNNGKGGVASPTHGAYIDVQSVYSHNNAFGLYASNDSTRTVKGRISNCVFKDNSNKDIYINDGSMVGWNNIYDTKSVSAGSTFTEF